MSNLSDALHLLKTRMSGDSGCESFANTHFHICQLLHFYSLPELLSIAFIHSTVTLAWLSENLKKCPDVYIVENFSNKLLLFATNHKQDCHLPPPPSCRNKLSPKPSQEVLNLETVPRRQQFYKYKVTNIRAQRKLGRFQGLDEFLQFALSDVFSLSV